MGKGNPNWVKGGKSPNPAGRKPSGFARADLFRKSGERIDANSGKTLMQLGIDKLVENFAIGDPDSGKIVLDSAFGKIVEEIKMTQQYSKPLDLSKLSDRELKVFMALLTKAEPDDADISDEG